MTTKQNFAAGDLVRCVKRSEVSHIGEPGALYVVNRVSIRGLDLTGPGHGRQNGADEARFVLVAKGPGWTLWDGGANPAPGATVIYALDNNPLTTTELAADALDWSADLPSHLRIVAYRVAKPAAERTALKTFQPGDVVRRIASPISGLRELGDISVVEPRLSYCAATIPVVTYKRKLAGLAWSPADHFELVMPAGGYLPGDVVELVENYAPSKAGYRFTVAYTKPNALHELDGQHATVNVYPLGCFEKRLRFIERPCFEKRLRFVERPAVAKPLLKLNLKVGDVVECADANCHGALFKAADHYTITTHHGDLAVDTGLSPVRFAFIPRALFRKVGPDRGEGESTPTAPPFKAGDLVRCAQPCTAFPGTSRGPKLGASYIVHKASNHSVEPLDTDGVPMGDGWINNRFELISRPDADGWYAYDGTKGNPVPGRRVEWRNKGGDSSVCAADTLAWGSDGDSPVVAFRLVDAASKVVSRPFAKGDLVRVTTSGAASFFGYMKAGALHIVDELIPSPSTSIRLAGFNDEGWGEHRFTLVKRAREVTTSDLMTSDLWRTAKPEANHAPPPVPEIKAGDVVVATLAASNDGNVIAAGERHVAESLHGDMVALKGVRGLWPASMFRKHPRLIDLLSGYPQTIYLSTPGLGDSWLRSMFEPRPYQRPFFDSPPWSGWDVQGAPPMITPESLDIAKVRVGDEVTIRATVKEVRQGDGDKVKPAVRVLASGWQGVDKIADHIPTLAVGDRVKVWGEEGEVRFIEGEDVVIHTNTGLNVYDLADLERLP